MFSIDQQQPQDPYQEEIYLSPSQIFPPRALWDDNDFSLNSNNIQASISRATSPIFITKKWNNDEELNKTAMTSSGGSTVFDAMNGLDGLMELEFNESISMNINTNAIEDEYVTATHTPNINETCYNSLVEPDMFFPQISKQLGTVNFKKNNSLKENSMTPITSNVTDDNSSLTKKKEYQLPKADLVAEKKNDVLNENESETNTNSIKVKKVYNNKGKSISDSRLSTESLRQSFQLPSVKAATKLESYVEKLLIEHCNFQLGYKTWVRDTEKDERDHILNILEQRLNDDMEFLSTITGRHKKLEKRSIETIVRKCTYAKQQSRLRKERRKAVEINNKLANAKV